MDNEFDKFTSPADTSGKTIAQLERNLEELKVKKNEDRLCFLVALIILIDVIFFTHMGGNWAAPICILILELILLIVVGRRLDVKDVEMLTNNILRSFQKK